MASYRMNSKAEEDLLNIWRYVAESSPASATKLVRAFHQHFTLLAENTRLGKRGQTSPQNFAIFLSSAISSSIASSQTV